MRDARTLHFGQAHSERAPVLQASAIELRRNRNAPVRRVSVEMQPNYGRLHSHRIVAGNGRKTGRKRGESPLTSCKPRKTQDRFLWDEWERMLRKRPARIHRYGAAHSTMLACEKPMRQDVFAETVPIGGTESDQCGKFALLLRVQQSGACIKHWGASVAQMFH